MALEVACADQQWSATDPGRTQIADPTHGLGEYLVGSAEDPSRAGEAGVQGLCPNRCQVHAPAARRRTSPGWRTFLVRHAAEIWACDFFCVQTLWFKTLYAFFVVNHASREVLHVQVTQHPTAEWVAQQIVECCGWDRSPPRFLIHDRDSRYGALFDRRLQNLGIAQIRTPFSAPQANSIAERWVRSVRQECLDHTFIFGERHLRRVLAEYITYFNQWRPHRSIGQRAPCAPARKTPDRPSGKIVAVPVLGGLHHIYQLAA